LTVGYDGTDFSGWAVQPGKRTVCETLATALELEPAAITVAGRTDAGVHAAANVVSVALPRMLPAEAISSRLPDDVAVFEVSEAPGFDARADARSRSYVYRINPGRVADPLRRRFERHYPHRLDLSALQACADELLGTHDFRAFTPSDTRHTFFERTVLEASWQRVGDRIEFRITADGFLRHMVRVIVGTMLERPDPALFRRLAAGAPRSAAGRTAFPHGLTLVSVAY
jgi:tRNA pseudouridine38-40 synthase